MATSRITKKEVQTVANQAQLLIDAFDRRSETSEYATLGEEDALFNLWYFLDKVWPPK